MQQNNGLERWVTKRNGARLLIIGGVGLLIGICGFVVPALLAFHAVPAAKASYEEQTAFVGVVLLMAFVSILSSICAIIAPMLAMAGVGIYVAAHSEEQERQRSG